MMQGIERRPVRDFDVAAAMAGGGAVGIVFVDSVAQIGQMTWDALCASRQYCRYRYMAALEASGLDCQFIYAVAQDDSGVRGIALATLWRLRLLGKMGLRVLTTGSPVNTGSPLMLAPGADAVRVAGELMRAMERKADEMGVRLFVGRDMPAAQAAHLPPLERLYACAYLDVSWPNFEQYLASRGKRKSIRRDMRAIDKAGYTLEVRQGPGLSQAEAARLHQLWLPLYHKHRCADQIFLTEAFFQEMSKLEHAVWLLLCQDGVIYAFDLCFALGDTLESTYCGIDLAATGRLAVHRVMGYEIVRFAIENHFGVVNFGISNAQSKVEAGCRLRMHYAWIQAYPKWLGAMLRPLLLKAILQNGDSGTSDSDRRA